MSKETLRELLNELRDSTPATTKLFVNVSMELQEAIYDRLEQNQMSIEELIEKAGITEADFSTSDEESNGSPFVFSLGHVENPRIDILVKISYALDINLFQVAANEYDNVKNRLKLKNKK